MYITREIGWEAEQVARAATRALEVGDAVTVYAPKRHEITASFYDGRVTRRTKTQVIVSYKAGAAEARIRVEPNEGGHPIHSYLSSNGRVEILASTPEVKAAADAANAEAAEHVAMKEAQRAAREQVYMAKRALDNILQSDALTAEQYTELAAKVTAVANWADDEAAKTAAAYKAKRGD